MRLLEQDGADPDSGRVLHGDRRGGIGKGRLAQTAIPNYTCAEIVPHIIVLRGKGMHQPNKKKKLEPAPVIDDFNFTL